MPEIKFDRRHDRQQWQAMALIGAPILLALVYGFATGSVPMSGFVIVFIASGAAIVWYIRLIYRYRCPQCAQHLPYRGGPTPGAKIFYHCHHCDVLWDTGQQEESDSTPPPPAKPPSPELLARIEPLLLQNKRIDAVKLWRSECGGSLSEAVFRINEMNDRLRATTPEKGTGPKTGG